MLKIEPVLIELLYGQIWREAVTGWSSLGPPIRNGCCVVSLSSVVQSDEAS